VKAALEKSAPLLGHYAEAKSRRSAFKDSVQPHFVAGVIFGETISIVLGIAGTGYG